MIFVPSPACRMLISTARRPIFKEVYEDLRLGFGITLENLFQMFKSMIPQSNGFLTSMSGWNLRNNSRILYKLHQLKTSS